ncbi:MAG: type IV secretory system conjugative DNA transfer family protein [Candidatus Comchoanobacterales bacterium]
MKTSLKQGIVAVMVSITLTHCAPPDSFDEVDAYNDALSSAALAYGAQSGLAWQADKINAVCESHARQLDQIYAFGQLMLPQSITPPVLQESRHQYFQQDSETVRTSDRNIDIIKPAAFVTTTPSWRQYLTMHFEKPKQPHQSVLPHNQKEKELWNQKVNEGWHHGVQQAHDVFEDALGLLNRDFTGMALYHSLIATGLITPPYAEPSSLGTTGDEQSMRINEQLIRITEQAKLNPHRPQHWQPAVQVDS